MNAILLLSPHALMIPREVSTGKIFDAPLEAGLKQLSPKIRSTFVLFAELELSYKEISEVQKIPMGTVMSRINAAARSFSKFLNWDSLKEID